MANLVLSSEDANEAVCWQCLDRIRPNLFAGRLCEAFNRVPSVKTECPYCLTKASDVLKQGLVGCPLCYEVFGMEVWKEFGLAPQSVADGIA